LVTVASH